jgi:nucleoside-diphosphate-sugar epimerase
MSWKNETALVTGGGGFLGGAVISALMRAGCGKIRILGRSPRPRLEKLGVEVFQGDIADFDAVGRACRGASVVFHTAAKAGVWGRRSDFYSANVIGTKNIIEACRKNGAGALIHTSSPSVAYTGDENVEGSDESIGYPEKYLAFYPWSKALAEKEALAAASDSLRVCALRPHLIWGVGDNHLLPRVAARARAGRLVRVGDGSNIVDLTHADNAAAAHILAAAALMETGVPNGKAYFISDGAPVNLWGWIDNLLVKMSLPAVTKSVSCARAMRAGAVMEFVWRALPFLKGEPPLTRFTAAQLGRSHYFNISAAKRDFGFSPSGPAELAAALDGTVEWLLRKTSV